MERIAGFVLRHKLLVAVFWVVAAVAGVATLTSTTKHLTTEGSLPGQPGYLADTRIQALYHNGGDQVPTIVTVTAPAGQRLTGSAGAAAARTLAAAAAAVPGTRLADASTTGDAHFVTADGRAEFGLLFTPGKGGFGASDPSARIRHAAAAAAPAGWTVGLTGLGQLETGSSAGKGTGALTETLLGGVGAVVVLGFVFASFLALLPLLMAMVAVPATFLLVGGLTHITSVSVIVEFLIALIGLGVAIDYSLLVVTRWREFRAQGVDNEQAVIRSMSTAGRAVVFSGLTVAVSLFALIVLPVPFLSSVGVAGAMIPLVSIAVACSLLPVLLAAVGPRLDWPRLRREGHASRPWTAWARLVVRYRRTAAVVGGGALIALLVPLASIRMGEPATSALAQTGPAHTALAGLTDGGVPSGVITPVEVLTRAADAAPVSARLAGVPGVYTAFAPDRGGYRAAGTAVVDVLPAAEPSSPAGAATVARVTAVADRLPGVLGVGGAGPTQADFIHAVYGSFPLMLALIALCTFVLLTRAFRSIVLAAKAVLFNLLSVGAAYGVMVAVWQWGYGSRAVWGVPATGSITVWVPLMVFAFLFGLSMDYEVFILARMREAYDATGSTASAVVTGIGRTGRLVTSAALILFLGFVSMSTASMTDLRVMATGLGAGILLDALVVRSLLVPALVGVLGRWNWWLPAWAARPLRVAPSPLPPRRGPAAEAPELVLAGR